MFRETHARSAMKALSWRITGTAATTLLVYVFTQRFVLSLAVGGLEFVTKVGVYWLHERMWDRLSFGRTQVRPAVLWFTGLTGSGKSTVARWVAQSLRSRGLPVEELDGDTVRDIFPETGFTKAERDIHIRRVGHLASRLEHNGIFVVASFVSPYAESRAFVRTLCHEFVEIHVATPLEECERRDTKGLYAKARAGEIRNFTGIDDPYEAPASPDVVINTSLCTPEQAGGQVLDAVRKRVGKV